MLRVYPQQCSSRLLHQLQPAWCYSYARRWQSSSGGAPTDSDVIKAYRTLGLDPARHAHTELDELAVKKKYFAMAKQCHPDANPSSSSNGSKGDAARMTEINDANSTLKAFFKAGGDPRRLVGGPRNPFETAGGQSSGRWEPPPSSYWTMEDHGGGFRPDDMNAAYWEGFVPPEGFAHPLYGDPHGGDGGFDIPFESMSPEEFMEFQFGMHGGMHMGVGEDFSAYQRPRRAGGAGFGEQQGHRGQRRSSPKRRGESRFEKPAFTDSEREALVNMHRAGKSFDFIANSLGHLVSDVVDEFNLLSKLGIFDGDDDPYQHEPASSDPRAHRRRGGPRRGEGGGPSSAWVDFDGAEFDPFNDVGGGADFYVEGVRVSPGKFRKAERNVNKPRQRQRAPEPSAEEVRQHEARMAEEYDEFLRAEPFKRNVHQHSSFEREPPPRDRSHTQQQHHSNSNPRGRGGGGGYYRGGGHRGGGRGGGRGDGHRGRGGRGGYQRGRPDRGPSTDV